AHQTDLRLAKEDLLRAVHHRLKAGATEPVHRERGDLLRTTSLQPHVTREVDGIRRGLHHVAEDRVLDLPWIHAGPLHRRLGRVNGQVDSTEISECAAEGAERRANTRKKTDIARAALGLH